MLSDFALFHLQLRETWIQIHCCYCIPPLRYFRSYGRDNVLIYTTVNYLYLSLQRRRSVSEKRMPVHGFLSVHVEIVSSRIYPAWARRPPPAHRLFVCSLQRPSASRHLLESLLVSHPVSCLDVCREDSSINSPFYVTARRNAAP